MKPCASWLNGPIKKDKVFTNRVVNYTQIKTKGSQMIFAIFNLPKYNETAYMQQEYYLIKNKLDKKLLLTKLKVYLKI